MKELSPAFSRSSESNSYLMMKFRIYLKRILLNGAETWTTTKREDNKIQAMEMKFLRVILNKTKDRIRNTNIRLELGVDEINK